MLVTTLTKKMSEDLTDYLLENGVRTRYLHSEVDTLRRIELLRELRLGQYDVLVGINLLREGLDLPEVSLVAILDADKEGFLRSGTSLIQTIGRAARNVSGQVIMYADRVTDSMERAIDETNRRRAKQVAYNEAAGVDPQPLRKKIADITDMLAREDADTEQLLGGGGRQQSRGKAPVPGLSSRDKATAARDLAGMPARDLAELVQELTDQMHAAAEELQFEVAARMRDEISELKKELRQMVEAGRARCTTDGLPRRVAGVLPDEAGRLAGRAVGGRRRGQGRRRRSSRSSAARQHDGRPQVRRDPRRGRRVADPLPRRGCQIALHRSIRMEHPRRGAERSTTTRSCEAIDASYDAIVAKLPKVPAADPAVRLDWFCPLRAWETGRCVEGSIPSQRCRHHGIHLTQGEPGAAGSARSSGRDLRNFA